MQNLRLLLLLLFASSCKLDLFPENFKEDGKIRGRMIDATNGKPVPGIIVKVSSGGGGGLFATTLKDYQYTYSDENGYFQVPRMVASGSYNSIGFNPDSVRWEGYLLAHSGFRNEGSVITDVYEFFKPTILKLKVNYDTSQIWTPYDGYDIYQFNYNPHLHVYGSDINTVNKDGYLILSWFPEVRRNVRINFAEKNGSYLSTIKMAQITNEVCNGDTCYATTTLP